MGSKCKKTRLRRKPTRKDDAIIVAKQVIQHDDFMRRIEKTFYYGVDDDNETDTFSTISHPLAQLASEKFSKTHQGHSLNHLNLLTVDKLEATPCSLIVAMIYLDRLMANNSNYVRSIAPTELFLVSMMISTKFYCGADASVYVSDFAEPGDMTIEHLITLEASFLDAMAWNIFVSEEQFLAKQKEIEIVLAKRIGLTRGWLTYTELVQLLPSSGIAMEILKEILLFSLGYVAYFMTIFGAILLISSFPSASRVDEQTVAVRNGNGTRNLISAREEMSPNRVPENGVDIADEQLDSIEVLLTQAEMEQNHIVGNDTVNFLTTIFEYLGHWNYLGLETHNKWSTLLFRSLEKDLPFGHEFTNNYELPSITSDRMRNAKLCQKARPNSFYIWSSLSRFI